MKKNKHKMLRSCENKSDLAYLLGVSPVFLTKTLYTGNIKDKYTSFSIPKKSGGVRTISAPNDNLKEIQSKLSILLLDCIDSIQSSKKTIPTNNISHGFEREKSIITNAQLHLKKKNILNIDIENYFESFNYGRVRAFFLKNKNFILQEDVANCLAKIACLDDKLPQGSPCSPVIANLITKSLDKKLFNISKKYSCIYSRYADDLTFSTNKNKFPDFFACYDSDKKSAVLNKKLEELINRYGFYINNSKTRFQTKYQRQEVTGLTVNKKLNTSLIYNKKVRAMVNSYLKTGTYTVEGHDTEKLGPPSLQKLEGMLGFIDTLDKYNSYKRYNNINYDGLEIYNKDNRNKRERLYGEFIFAKNFVLNRKPVLIVEGKTDIVYLKCAIISNKKYFPLFFDSENNIAIKFYINNNKNSYLTDTPSGASGLAKIIREHVKVVDGKCKDSFSNIPVIIIADNDSGKKSIYGSSNINIETQKKLDKEYKSNIKNNLYIVLTDGENSCIEDLFDCEVLKRKLDGKSFNISNNTCLPDQYGKHVFSKKIISADAKNISFDKFQPILKRIYDICFQS